MQTLFKKSLAALALSVLTASSAFAATDMDMNMTNSSGNSDSSWMAKAQVSYLFGGSKVAPNGSQAYSAWKTSLQFDTAGWNSGMNRGFMGANSSSNLHFMEVAFQPGTGSLNLAGSPVMGYSSVLAAAGATPEVVNEHWYSNLPKRTWEGIKNNKWWVASGTAVVAGGVVALVDDHRRKKHHKRDDAAAAAGTATVCNIVCVP